MADNPNVLSYASPARPLGGIAKAFVALLLCVDAAGCLFGAVVLAWAVSELSYSGERWGLLGVLFFGGAALLIMLLLAAASGTMAAVAWRKLPRSVAVVLIVTSLLGAGINAAAVLVAMSNLGPPESTYASNHPLYLLGLYEAVRGGDTTRARVILAADAPPLE